MLRRVAAAASQSSVQFLNQLRIVNSKEERMVAVWRRRSARAESIGVGKSVKELVQYTREKLPQTHTHTLCIFFLLHPTKPGKQKSYQTFNYFLACTRRD